MPDHIREQIEELRKLHEAATPAPWAWEMTGDKDNTWGVGVIFDDDDQPVAGRNERGENDLIEAICDGSVHPPDAELIVAMRNALPEILALLAGEGTPAVTRVDIVRVLEAIIDEGETAEAYKRAETQLMELLGATPGQVFFVGRVVDHGHYDPASGDPPWAHLDGEWLVRPEDTAGVEVQVLAASGEARAIQVLDHDRASGVRDQGVREDASARALVNGLDHDRAAGEGTQPDATTRRGVANRLWLAMTSGQVIQPEQADAVIDHVTDIALGAGEGTPQPEPGVRGHDGLRMVGLPAELVTYDSIEGETYSVVPGVVIPHPTGTRVVLSASGEGTTQPDPSRPVMADGAHLFFAVYMPDVDPQDENNDPDMIADALVGIINEERVRNGGADAVGFDSPEVKPVMVSGIPAPQWLTPETLANLKRAASGEGTAPQPADPEWEVYRGYGVRHKDGARAWCYTASQVQSPRLAQLMAAMLNAQIPGGTAPQVPAEALCVRCHVSLRAGDSPLCAACKRPDYPDVLWEGETKSGFDMHKVVAVPGVSYLPTDEMSCPPGTRVRVVAADGAPTTDAGGE